jgi:hypothetical protein
VLVIYTTVTVIPTLPKTPSHRGFSKDTPPETLALDFRNKIILGSGITQWVITTLTVFHRPIIFYTHCVPGPGYRSESALAPADSAKSQTYITDLDTPRGASAQRRVHAQEVIDDNDMPGL